MYIYHTKKPTQNLFLHVCPVLPHNESMIQIQWFIIKHHGTHNPIPQQSAKKSLLIHTHTHSHILQHATIQTLLNTRSLINVKLHTRTAQGNIRNALFSSGVLFNFLLWSYFFPEPPCQLEKKVHIRHIKHHGNFFLQEVWGVQSSKNWHILNTSDPTARTCWTFYTNLIELRRTYTERTVGTLVYLKTVASWPVSLLNLWNLNVQCMMCSLDVRCIRELQENIYGCHFKYKQKLNINCNISKYNM